MLKFLARFFGSRNQRLLRLYQRLVDAANAFEPKMQALKDEDFPALTAAFRERLAAGETTDDLLPEAFAAVREAAKRSLGMRHFDVQFIGGITLHQGKISEMRTGEGKTLVATLPTYLNALPAKGVHVVTVNDYLATRDAEWMGPVYRFLGLSVGVIRSGQTSEEKRAAYGCDITYGTNNEYGFDYLRDNLTFRLEDRVQRGEVHIPAAGRRSVHVGNGQHKGTEHHPAGQGRPQHRPDDASRPCARGIVRFFSRGGRGLEASHRVDRQQQAQAEQLEQAVGGRPHVSADGTTVIVERDQARDGLCQGAQSDEQARD